jgi:hypothetical protein
LLKEDAPDLRDYERMVIRSIFWGGRSIRFSEMAEHFREAIPDVQRRLHEEVAKQGLFRENPEAVRRRNAASGIAMLVLGIGLAIFLPILLGQWLDLIWAPFIGLAVAGAVRLAFSRAMPRRTQAGTLEAARWRAFARHLAERAPVEKVAAEKELFEPYLPYAIALGVDSQWMRKLAEAGTPAPRWYETQVPPVIILGGPGYGGGWGGPGWGGPMGRGPGSRDRDEPNEGREGGRRSFGGGDLQDMSDSLADMLNRASESLARGGGGGWSGGGGGWGGGGGGGSGGFN